MLSFFEQSIQSLKGISKTNSNFYARLNLNNFRDFLFFLPKKYLKLSNEIIEDNFIIIQIKIVKKKRISAKIFQIYAFFNTKMISFYVYNVRFYKLFFINQTYNIGGIFEKINDIYKIKDFKIFNEKQQNFVIYSNNVPSYSFQKYILEILSLFPFNEEIIQKLFIKDIFFNLHNGIDYEKSLFALKYLEAMFFLNVFAKKENYEPILIDFNAILQQLPFYLSYHQYLICSNICKYLSSNQQMNYLVYGEVGSGKTIIAIVAILMSIQLEFTTIILVPTVALAVQHYEEIIKVIDPLKCLLYASFTKKKDKVKSDILQNKYKVIVSTHALLYIDSIPNVGLVIIDEMHKFGVIQRSKLVQSAVRKNVLLLSATPIPRSLSMILNQIIDYDYLPSYKEKNITTHWIKNFEILLEKIKDKKVYWILPNIEDSDEIIGVNSRYDFLKKRFDNVLLLHGKLKDSEKLEIVDTFKNLSFGILVATTIVEIGINITDADIMIIEHAERFGLSQLHQLRGRVGRNGQRAYCFLISQYRTKKIEYMKKYSMGYEISEKDLDLRKSGRLTGLMQHGCNSFYFLEVDDNAIFNEAKNDNRKLESFALFNGLI